MKHRKTVLVLFGGVSSEHEISRMSAASILTHIDRQVWEVQTAGITKAGRWLLTKADTEAIRDGSWEQDPSNRNLLLSLDPDQPGFRAGRGLRWEQIHIDIVFPVLHGRNGEDGKVQGMLYLAGIPCVGSDTTSSAACMDKGITKALVAQAEAAEQARCCIIHRSECDPQEAAEGADAFFKGEYPLFVKPAREGSSVGITKVVKREQLPRAIRTAFAQDSKVLVEEAIVGRELEVAVLGNETPSASCIGEIFTAGEFYDYESKYVDEESRTEIVTDLPKDKEQEIRETAVRLYRILECRGLARMDFFLCENGRVVFNEANTIPGFTNISMYPSLWQASGLTYSGLIDALLVLALEGRE